MGNKKYINSEGKTFILVSKFKDKFGHKCVHLKDKNGNSSLIWKNMFRDEFIKKPKK